MNCECAYCKNDLPFELPDELINATLRGDLVVFAGAGISTESEKVFKETLYEDIRYELGLENVNIDFPALMTKFCQQRNGRKLLLEKIRNRFEYCQQYSELYRIASKFHKELSSIYFIDKIFTTNWDDYFERECNSIPIVTPEDFAFYNISERKVFKIHGSISNYGSLIATTEDYKNCYNNLKNGIIGSYLKTTLATKVVLFVGFSFRDFDFNKIYSFLKKEMKEVIPHCYIVTIDDNMIEKFSSEKATVIHTDGTYFISVLRKHLEGCRYLFPREYYDTVEHLSQIRSISHKKSVELFFKTKTPIAVYNLFYQDGIRHAFDYLTYNVRSGITFNPRKIFDSIDAYRSLLKEFRSAKNYSTYAYIEGYINGLYSMLCDDPKRFPFYYIIGYGPVDSINKFKTIVKQGVFHKTAHKVGLGIFKSVLRKDSSIVPHHPPFIF